LGRIQIFQPEKPENPEKPEKPEKPDNAATINAGFRDTWLEFEILDKIKKIVA